MLSATGSVPFSSPACPTDVGTARDFTRHLSHLLRDEQHALVKFLYALAECDGRRLWAELGYASLFDFLHRELGLSRSAAYHRSAAAWLVQRYPQVADALADGRICLTSVAEIGKVITPDNAREILPRFFHRSTREAKEIVAEIAPATIPAMREVITVLPSITPAARSQLHGPAAVAHRPEAPVDATNARATSADASFPFEIPSTATTVPEPSATPGFDDHGQSSRSLEVPPSPPESRLAPDAGQNVHARGRNDSDQLTVSTSEEAPRQLIAAAASRTLRDEVQPLTSDLRRIHITVTKRWLEKLDAAKAALSHSIPGGSAEAVLDAALDALLAQEAKRKGLLVKKPRPWRSSGSPSGMQQPQPPPEQGARDSTGSRPATASTATDSSKQRTKRRRAAIAAEVRREVVRRDEGRCQAPLHDGTVCGSRVRLQLDHIVPIAIGGSSTVDNLRLLCARHNQLAAREVFGEAWMDSFGAGPP